MKKVNGYEIKPGAKLIGANLENVDLSGLDLNGANLRDAKLSGANLRDANLTNANLTGAKLTRANLTDANLNVALLIDVDLTGANLTRANLRGTGLYDSNLTNANLTGANLTGANLESADLTGAKLKDANLENFASLTGAFLKGANLENVDLSYLNLTRANLEGANLKGANLTVARLIDANLKGANLFGANLNGANLTGATLSGVDIRGALMDVFILKGKINLNGTIYNNNTKGLDKYKSRMVFGFNLLVTSEYKNRVIKYNFKINEKLPSEIKIKYAFIKKSSAFNIMSLHDWTKNKDPYDTLTFNNEKQEIEKIFELNENAKISEDLELYIRIKESQGKIMNINGKKFDTQFDFLTTIPKNTDSDGAAAYSTAYSLAYAAAYSAYSTAYSTAYSAAVAGGAGDAAAAAAAVAAATAAAGPAASAAVADAGGPAAAAVAAAAAVVADASTVAAPDGGAAASAASAVKAAAAADQLAGLTAGDAADLSPALAAAVAQQTREPDLIITNKDNSVQYVNISNIYQYVNAGYGREEMLQSATDILKSAIDIDGKRINFENVKSIIIQGNLKIIQEEAFQNINSLEHVTIGDNVKKINTKAFFNCINLKSVIIGNGVNMIGDKDNPGRVVNALTAYRGSTFEGCENLKTVILGNNLLYVSGIRDFYGCKNLKSLTLPDSFRAFNFYYSITISGIDKRPTFYNSGLETVYATKKNSMMLNEKLKFGKQKKNFYGKSDVTIIDLDTVKYNLNVKSIYENKKVTYTFTLNKDIDKDPVSEVKIQYAFRKSTKAYSIMKNLPDGYQTLTFNQITKKITKTFNLQENAKFSEDLKLDIRIKESQGKIMNINGKKFDTKIDTHFDFSTTIPKNTGIELVNLPNYDPLGHTAADAIFFSIIYNLTVSSEYNKEDKNVKFEFEINPKPDLNFEVIYAFRKNIKAYSIMKNLPDGYQTLTFNQITKKITKTFKLKEDALISEDLILDIRIKESKGEITYINGQQFKTQYDFSTTIPKNTEVKKVEVVKGPSGVLYGSGAVGGIKLEGKPIDVSIQQTQQMTTNNTFSGVNALKNKSINKNLNNNNVAIGNNSLTNMVIGKYNTAFGVDTMSNTMSNSKGINVNGNTAIGNNSLQNVTGNLNTAIGYGSGNNIENGSNNILIGVNSETSNVNSQNEIVIGNESKGHGNNRITLGNDATTNIQGKNVKNSSLGSKNKNFNTLYTNSLNNGIDYKLPTKNLKGKKYIKVDKNGNMTLVDLQTILNNIKKK